MYEGLNCKWLSRGAHSSISLFLTRFYQPIFARQSINRTKIPQGESRHCHCKRTRSYVRAKSGCVNDSYPGFTLVSSIIPNDICRSRTFFVLMKYFFVYARRTQWYAKGHWSEKTDGYSRSPDFPVKSDKFIVIDSKQHY